MRRYDYYNCVYFDGGVTSVLSRTCLYIVYEQSSKRSVALNSIVSPNSGDSILADGIL